MKTQHTKSPSVNQPYTDSYPQNIENLKLDDEDHAYHAHSDDNADDFDARDKSQQIAEDKLKDENDDYDDDDDDYDESEDNELRDRLIRERSKLIVNEFLQQVEENRFFEFSWPPDSDCPAYKYGYISDYVEDIVFVNQSETATKFVDQVRRSWGYDIDCVPPCWIGSRLRPIEFQNERDNMVFYDKMMSTAKLVIDRINTQAEKMGKTFELVQVNKVVLGSYCLFLLTLTIKEVEADSEMYVRATVSTPIGHDLELEECKLVSSLST